ncbi:MAG: type IV pilus modification protein PilV [Burkholderiales bacterium]
MIRHRPPSSRSDGFTLIEVLVALVIMAIGLLALVAIQLVTLRNNSGSYLRSQAAVAVGDLVDRMRVNQTVANTTTNYVHATPDAAPPNGPNCDAGTCDENQIAAYDLNQWWASTFTILPGMGATVTCTPNPCTGNSVYTITVMWDDGRTGATGTACGPDPNVDRLCYRVSFDP